jgi:hypothetical protein
MFASAFRIIPASRLPLALTDRALSRPRPVGADRGSTSPPDDQDRAFDQAALDRWATDGGRCECEEN